MHGQHAAGAILTGKAESARGDELDGERQRRTDKQTDRQTETGTCLNGQRDEIGESVRACVRA